MSLFSLTDNYGADSSQLSGGLNGKLDYQNLRTHGVQPENLKLSPATVAISTDRAITCTTAGTWYDITDMTVTFVLTTQTNVVVVSSLLATTDGLGVVYARAVYDSGPTVIDGFGGTTATANGDTANLSFSTVVLLNPGSHTVKLQTTHSVNGKINTFKKTVNSTTGCTLSCFAVGT